MQIAFRVAKHEQSLPSVAPNTGFTLIELSIVLVIIGLIVGGILVGQDLINGAAIRSQVTHVEQYKSAVNTFKNKYNDLPGDMTALNASAFGFITRTGTTGQGDGNGLVEGCSAGATVAGCETILFWRGSKLSSAPQLRRF